MFPLVVPLLQLTVLLLHGNTEISFPITSQALSLFELLRFLTSLRIIITSLCNVL